MYVLLFYINMVDFIFINRNIFRKFKYNNFEINSYEITSFSKWFYSVLQTCGFF